MNKNLIASIVFALGFILFFILVMPQYDAVGFAKENLKTKRMLLDERTAELDNFKNLDRQAKARQTDIGKVVVFAPPKKQIDEVVSSIQKVVADSGLQLISMTTAELAATTENYRKITLGPELQGQYPAFVNFLGLLEQNLRLYDISEIAASVNTGVSGGVNFSVKITAYYLK